MIKDITFGQYYGSNSVIHRMDSRVKIVLMILFIVLIFISNTYSVFFTITCVITVLYLTRVPIKMFLKNLKVILPILIITMIINIFAGGGETILASFWIFKITAEGILRSFFMSTRIVLLILISSVLTYTTTPNDLTDAIESLLSPLRVIGLKSAVHILAMMMTIALRFIPTLTEDAEKIMNAQKARGADLESGTIIDRVKALIPILIPLLISSIRRAYELTEAMECRCYNGGVGKTRMKQMKLSKIDYISIIISVLVTFILIGINVFS